MTSNDQSQASKSKVKYDPDAANLKITINIEINGEDSIKKYPKIAAKCLAAIAVEIYYGKKDGKAEVPGERATRNWKIREFGISRKEELFQEAHNAYIKHSTFDRALGRPPRIDELGIPDDFTERMRQMQVDADWKLEPPTPQKRPPWPQMPRVWFAMMTRRGRRK